MTSLEQKVLLSNCVSQGAYAFIFKNAGIFSEEEYALLQEGLKEVALFAQQNCLEREESDPQIFIENYLYQKNGGLTQKFKTALSTSQYENVAQIVLWRMLILDIYEALLRIEKQLYDRLKPGKKAIKALAITLADDLTLLQQNYMLLCQVFGNTKEDVMLGKLLGFDENVKEVGKSEANLLLALFKILNNLCLSTFLNVNSLQRYLEDTRDVLIQNHDEPEMLQQSFMDTLQAIEAFHDWMTLEDGVVPSENKDAKRLEKRLSDAKVWLKQKHSQWHKRIKNLL